MSPILSSEDYIILRPTNSAHISALIPSPPQKKKKKKKPPACHLQWMSFDIDFVF